MDKLTPQGAEGRDLTVRFRGYDRREVNDLVTALSAKVIELSGQVEAAQMDLARQKDMEGHMNAALLEAQKSAEQTRSEARAEADRILAEARTRIFEERKSASERLNDLRWEIENLRQDKKRFVQDFQNLLGKYISEMAEHERHAVVALPEEADASTA